MAQANSKRHLAQLNEQENSEIDYICESCIRDVDVFCSLIYALGELYIDIF